jgi:hypothetical protein
MVGAHSVLTFFYFFTGLNLYKKELYIILTPMVQNIQRVEKPVNGLEGVMTIEEIDVRKLQIVEEVKRLESLTKEIEGEVSKHTNNAEMDKADKAYSDLELLEGKIRRLQEESQKLFEAREKLL